MKATEYAMKFKKNMSDREFEDAVKETLFGFLSEVDELTKQRNSKTDATFISIIKELSNKWNALSNLVPEINRDGFKLFMINSMPELKELL